MTPWIHNESVPKAATMQIAWHLVPRLNTPKREHIPRISRKHMYNVSFHLMFLAHLATKSLTVQTSPLARNVCFQGDQATGLGAQHSTLRRYISCLDTPLGFANSTSQCSTKLHGLFLERHTSHKSGTQTRTLLPNPRLEFQSSFHI